MEMEEAHAGFNDHLCLTTESVELVFDSPWVHTTITFVTELDIGGGWNPHDRSGFQTVIV